MNMESQILVPIDFSNESIKALDFATHLAKKIDKKVIVVNIIKSKTTRGVKLPFSSNWSHNANTIDSLFTYKLYRKNKKRLKALRNGWKNHESITNTAIRITSNDSLTSLKNLVDHYQPFLMVLPYSQHSKVEQYLTSNSTLEILRNINTPTLFVPEDSEIKDWKNIVFPSSFSNDVESSFVDVVNQINNGFGSNLHLVKVIENEVKNPEEIELKIESFAQEKGLRNYTVNSIKAKFVDEALDVFQQSVKSDLICMITKGQSGISQLFFTNSVTEIILKKVNKPILSMSVKNN